MFSGLVVTSNGACQYSNHMFATSSTAATTNSSPTLNKFSCYRYFILVNSVPEIKSVIKLCILVYFPTLIVLTPYTLRNSPEEIIRSIIKSYYPEYNLDNVVVAGDTTALEWSCFYMVSLSFVYTVSLIFRRKTLAYLDEAASNLSPETKKQHKKIVMILENLILPKDSIALTIQVCVLIFYHGGAGQFALGEFYTFSGPIIEDGTMSMEMMSMFTPLFSLYFIAPYRHAMLDWTGLSKFTNKNSSTVTPVSAVTDSKASLHDMA